MTSNLDTTELGPRYDVATTERVSINICQEDTTFRVSNELDATYTCGFICVETAEYKVDVEKSFGVEVEI